MITKNSTVGELIDARDLIKKHPKNHGFSKIGNRFN